MIPIEPAMSSMNIYPRCCVQSLFSPFFSLICWGLCFRICFAVDERSDPTALGPSTSTHHHTTSHHITLHKDTVRFNQQAWHIHTQQYSDAFLRQPVFIVRVSHLLLIWRRQIEFTNSSPSNHSIPSKSIHLRVSPSISPSCDGSLFFNRWRR